MNFMDFHLVAVSTLEDNEKVAFHQSSTSLNEVKGMQQELLEKSKDLKGMFNFHFIQTGSASWKSILELDSYFADMELFENEDDFVRKLRKGSVIKAVDVAGYVKDQLDIDSNLKLEKLIYLAYAKVLFQTGKRLFTEPIEAWDYGPVVPEVYRAFNAQTLPSNRSFIKKVVVTPKGGAMQKNIDSVLEKFGNSDPYDLTKLTHRSGTPWSKAYEELKNNELRDADILEYHRAHPGEL